MRNVLLALAFILAARHAYSQTPDNWRPWTITNQPSRYLKVQMAVWDHVLMSRQEFTVKITNTSMSKVSVSGTLTAHSYCGTDVKTNFNVTLKPGQTAGGQATVLDINLMSGAVWTDDNCNRGRKIPYTTQDVNGKNVTHYYLDVIQGLRLDDLQVEDITQKEKDEAAKEAEEARKAEEAKKEEEAKRAAAKAQSARNQSASGTPQSSTGNPQSTTGTTQPTTGTTQPTTSTTQSYDTTATRAPVTGPAYDLLKAQQDLMDTSLSLIRQGIETGNNTVYYIGLGGLVIGGIIVPASVGGSDGLKIVGEVFGGIAVVVILTLPDHFSRKWFTLKNNIGVGYEKIPIIINSRTSSSTGQSSLPLATASLKMVFFNNKGISLSVQPYANYGISGITKDHKLSSWQYGANGTLLIGKSNLSPVRLFVEGGWYKRHLTDSNTATQTGGALDFTTLRYGFGFMLWTLNKKGTRESWIKPGVFWERPSFLLSDQPATLVGNLQLMICNVLTIDASYGKNYFIGGNNYHSLSTSNGVNQNYFSVSLTKSTQIF